MSGVCVVIPALDCGGPVGAVVAAVRAATPGIPVVVVDDGSRDDTAARAAEAGALVLRHARRAGKGAALATGFAWALAHGHDAVATMDGDGQHVATELPRLLTAHEREPAALVVGARQIARTHGPMPAWNQVGNRISTYWIGVFAGQPVADSQSGFRVYPRAAIAAPPRSTGFETESELLLRAVKLGVPLRFVPVSTIYRPAAAHTSHFRKGWDTLRIIALVLRQTRWPAPR